MKFDAMKFAMCAALIALPSALQAQADDGRWLAWAGCWEGTDATAMLLCVEPVEGGVNLVSVEGDSRSVETIIANGMPQPIESDRCSGTRTAEFSADGERVYLREEVECGGVTAELTGMIAMISPTEWVDIRGAADRPDAVSRTFRRASETRAREAGFGTLQSADALATRMMRWQASEPTSFDDLLEVYGHIGEGATRAWVVEQIDPFPVDADALVRLADAGVPDRVIDVVVAHAFPDRFVLGEGAPSERAGPSSNRGDPYGRNAYPAYGRYGYGSYGFGWGSPYNYGYGYGYGYPYRDRFIVVQRYRPRTDVPQNLSPRVRPMPGVGYTGGRPSTSSSGASSSQGAAASSGSSRGRSTGRTAKPRTGGGGF